MNPISNQQFSHDAELYIYQANPYGHVVNHPPGKPFKVSSPARTAKSKKDLKKEKEKSKLSPFDLMSE